MVDGPRSKSSATSNTPGSRSRRSRRSTETELSRSATELNADWLADVAALSFQEARTALELAMAQLQADDLEVEEMAGLYRRAEAYASRCEAVLEQVEQEVIEWEAEPPPAAP